MVLAENGACEPGVLSPLHELDGDSVTLPEQDFIEQSFLGLAGMMHLLVPNVAIALLDVSSSSFASLHISSSHLKAEGLRDSCVNALLHCHTQLTGIRPDAMEVSVYEHEGQEVDPEGPVENMIHLIEPIDHQETLYGLLGIFVRADQELTEQHKVMLQQQAQVMARAEYQLASIRHTAWRDALTGVFNRRGLEAELYRCWMDSQRGRTPMAVVLTDLDHFKNINDKLGHKAGDRVLQEFVRVAQNVVRASDIVARYGGDEVLVILSHAGANEALAFSERLRETVAEHLFCPDLQGGLHLNASMGVAVMHPEDTQDTLDDLMARADSRLLEAKRQGRNRVCLHLNSEGESSGEDSTAPPESDESRVTGTVLVVDDDAMIARLMTRMLDGHGWRILACYDAEGALEHVRNDQPCPDVLIVDINLPGKSGLELLDEVRLANEHVMNIVITGETTMENALRALRRGAYDFLEKPLNPAAFVSAVERAMEIRKLRLENSEYQNHLEDLVEAKSRALRKTLRQVEDAHNFTLEALISLLDVREQSSGEHSVRGRNLIVALAEAMGFSKWEIVEFGRGALLHDIGKVAVPDYILLKPEALTDEEREIMQTHSEVGYRLLEGCPYLQRAAQIVYQHQEHFDGTGFPQGLRGKNICPGARLFSVIDAYDAMRSDRVYRKALTKEEALAELKKGRATQFDPDVVNAFIQHVDTMEQVGNWDQLQGLPPRTVSALDILERARKIREEEGSLNHVPGMRASDFDVEVV